MNYSKQKYRIKSPLRFTIFMIFVFTLFISALLMVLHIHTASSLEPIHYIEVQVEPGDTLWDIAEEIYTADTDLRAAVSEICQINHISASTLQPGQILRIPKRA